VAWFDQGNTLQTSDVMGSRAILQAIGPMEGLGAVVSITEPGIAESPGLAASVIEFAAEGLWLTRRIDKDDDGASVTYASTVVQTDDETDDDV
jgi:magnesium chelatase subunit I